MGRALRFNFGTALAGIPGRAPDAIAEYKAALRINPNYTDAHNNLGLALAGIPERSAGGNRRI